MRRSGFYFLITLALLGLLGLWYIYNNFIDSKAVPKTITDPFVFIPTGSNFEDVVAILKEKGFIQNEPSFRMLADYMKYKKPVMRAGKFKVEPGWSNIQLIRGLRGNPQAPVKVILTTERLVEEVAEKVADVLEQDKVSFEALFNDKNYLQEIGYTQETLMSLFIPNTYEFYWTTTPKQFIERMIREHRSFWEKENRLDKAKSLGYSQAEVYTLASIVEKETLQGSEKPRIAGVYLNRLKKGILLQADPTAVFATRDFDTGRVLYSHINVDSPYNTYKYKGLPPGPIAMASISSIDAVLNAEKHEYIYFCAKGDGSGLHSFAKTLEGHNQNVAIYKKNLRQRGIR